MRGSDRLLFEGRGGGGVRGAEGAGGGSLKGFEPVLLFFWEAWGGGTGGEGSSEEWSARGGEAATDCSCWGEKACFLHFG